MAWTGKGPQPPPGDKNDIESSTKLSKRVRERAEAIAFGDDRKVAYVLRRAIEEGLPILERQGVAPKRATPPTGPKR